MRKKNFIRLFPEGEKGGPCWLYAIGLPNGATKIGRTSRPKQRFEALCQEHGGGRAQWVHLGAKVDYQTAVRAEFIALSRASCVSQRVPRRELFDRLTRQKAIECLRHGLRVAVERMSQEASAPAQAAQAGG